MRKRKQTNNTNNTTTDSEMEKKEVKKNKTENETKEVIHSTNGENNKSWSQLLEDTKVEEICPKSKPLVVIESTTTIKRAMEILAEQKILSAPVIESTEKPTFLGFVDVLDICGFVLINWQRKATLFDDPAFVNHDFFQQKVINVLNFSGCDDPVVVKEGTSVAGALSVFCDPLRRHRGRVHRIAIAAADGDYISNVVSQSDVIAFASKHTNLLDIAKDTVVDLALVHATIMARIDSPFVDTLQILYQNRVSGIALVDEQSRISANLSASDLRSITARSFNYFSGSTMQFLVKGTKSEMGAPISVLPSCSLDELLQVIVREHVHRVYVTDAEGHTQGIVTLSDIMHVLRA